MSVENFQNGNALVVGGSKTTLVDSIDDNDLTFRVAGEVFPDNCRVRVGDELMRCLSNWHSGGDYYVSVERGVEGTTATSHSSGATITHVLTAGALDTFKTGLGLDGDLNTVVVSEPVTYFRSSPSGTFEVFRNSVDGLRFSLAGFAGILTGQAIIADGLSPRPNKSMTLVLHCNYDGIAIQNWTTVYESGGDGVGSSGITFTFFDGDLVLTATNGLEEDHILVVSFQGTFVRF